MTQRRYSMEMSFDSFSNSNLSSSAMSFIPSSASSPISFMAENSPPRGNVLNNIGNNGNGKVHLESSEQILPTILFRGEVFVIDQHYQVMSGLAMIKNEKILGFDMEWKPNLSEGEDNPIALIQISSFSICLLFRMNILGNIPPLLRDLLVNPSVTKVGHTLDLSDSLKLKEQYGIEMNNVVDIKEIAIQMNIYPLGLKALTRTFLRCYLDKKLAVSNWEEEVLSREQIYYAATDAWISRILYFKMTSQSIESENINAIIYKWAIFGCAVCTKEFRNKSALGQHLRHKKHQHHHYGSSPPDHFNPSTSPSQLYKLPQENDILNMVYINGIEDEKQEDPLESLKLVNCGNLVASSLFNLKKKMSLRCQHCSKQFQSDSALQQHSRDKNCVGYSGRNAKNHSYYFSQSPFKSTVPWTP
eukprot:TRINITY_DN9123_c0_g1_i1.p1 TRINITY_DN9123_c0_g1~~TRINITY_DN9123_c0_g1_i1.p1  ORF type:complete len:416 (-),score=110.96 TRINITY_DN9123_c0_g1_i1:205-1452(-)